VWPRPNPSLHRNRYSPAFAAFRVQVSSNVRRRALESRVADIGTLKRLPVESGK